jgi:hypothetical protein
VYNGNYLVSWHADERCEDRHVAAWQVVAGLEEGELVEERRHSEPNPSVVVRELLADGTVVEAIWSWLRNSRRAKLVTVYFPGAG